MSLLDEVKKIASKLKSRHEYLHGDKGKLEPVYQKIKQWKPEKDVHEVSRTAGLLGIDLAWFLFCLGKYTVKDLNTIFFDNKIIEKLKAKNQDIKIKNADSKFIEFFKKLKISHPKAAARLQLWMVYSLFTGMVIGGTKIAQYNNDDGSIKDNYVEHTVKRTLSFKEFKETLKPVTPLLITDLISKEGVKLLDVNNKKEKALYESVCKKKGLNPANKPHLHKPYKDSENNWTIGFGSTVLKDGTHVNRYTEPITDEEAYELARWHIEDYETYPLLYWYYVYDNDLLLNTTNEAVGMGSIFYNTANKLVENPRNKNNKERFEELRQYRDGKNGKMCYGANIPDSIILDCFARYPITGSRSFGDEWLNHQSPDEIANSLSGYFLEGGGIFWRRWLEAGLLSGQIDPYDLLDCPANGCADFFKFMGGYKKDNTIRKQILWQETDHGWEPIPSTYAAFKEWLRNPKTRDNKGNIGNIPNTRERVKDFLPPEILEGLRNNKYSIYQQLQYSDQDKLKTIAFNDGILKIKEKQNHSYDYTNYSNDGYTA